MDICTLTDSAKEQISNICRENNCFAVSLNVKGGGCAGFEYDWGLINSPEEIESNDVILKINGDYSFVVGATSVMFLIGTTVNYKKDIMGAAFEVNNPNAQSSCGCGISINFDMNKLATPAI
jgi:iron-sulfur cluster assembly accessory protein